MSIPALQGGFLMRLEAFAKINYTARKVSEGEAVEHCHEDDGCFDLCSTHNNTSEVIITSVFWRADLL